MKTGTSTTFNIAWFKLADFVARGEKERALSVLRLLMHSVSNEALTYQLEGDILLSFNDSAAIQKYQSAAQLFKKSNHLHQAINAYHQALQIQEETETLYHLLDIYLQIKHRIGISNTFARLGRSILKEDDFSKLQFVFDQILSTTDTAVHSLLYTRMTITVLLHDQSCLEIDQYLKKSIQLLKINTAYPQELSKFINEIKIISPIQSEYLQTLL